jgi:DNA-binding response OmpR family regulator
MTYLTKRAGASGNVTALKGVHVLIVEDNWHVAKALENTLKQIEMEVAGPAATTSDAKRLIERRMPAVAVVDVNLKREMACGLIDELHEKGVPVIVISGYAVPPISSDRAAVILQKPFSAAELLAALQGVARRLPQAHR